MAVGGAGWAACRALGAWVERAIAHAAERIDEVGRAHRAERHASELEAQQRRTRGCCTTPCSRPSPCSPTPASESARARSASRRATTPGCSASCGSARRSTPGPTAIFAPEAEDDDKCSSTTLESVRQRFARMGLEVNWHGAGQVALPREVLDASARRARRMPRERAPPLGVTQADVTVTDDERTVRAMVTDAGTASSPTTVDGARLGFAESVVGRLQQVGGRARLFSSPGSGTTVVLEVPKP